MMYATIASNKCRGFLAHVSELPQPECPVPAKAGLKGEAGASPALSRNCKDIEKEQRIQNKRIS